MATNYKAIAKKLKFEGRAFINGKYVNAIDGNKFETINHYLDYTISKMDLFYSLTIL